MNFNTFFQMNTVPISIFIYMTIFMISNKDYERGLTKNFFPVVILLLFNIIIDNLDQHFYMEKIFGPVRTAIGVFGYDIRILILMLLIFVSIRNIKSKYKYLLILPGIVCFTVTPLAFFTKLVFWYDKETGVLLRGPLSFTPHIVLGIYGLIMISQGIYKIFHKNAQEGVIIIVAVFSSIVATYAEARYLYRGLLLGTTSLIIVFYYLYIHTEYLKKDILTDTFNRMTYKAAIKKIDEIKYIIMIDLNNLKVLNDTMGHEEGDKALKTLADKVREKLPKSCDFYRIGGDEFVVLGKRDVNIEDVVKKIKQAMVDTPYKWAVGYSDIVDKDYDKSFSIADEKMYEDKKKMKII